LIDIDTDDPAQMKAIQDQLVDSAWVRIGAKGAMLAYRYNGTPTFRIKDVSGKMIVEHLSAKTQIVLPPSIHPTTKRPYFANSDLVGVLDQLREFLFRLTLPHINPRIVHFNASDGGKVFLLSADVAMVTIPIDKLMYMASDDASSET